MIDKHFDFDINQSTSSYPVYTTTQTQECTHATHRATHVPASILNQGCASAWCTFILLSCDTSSSFLTRSCAVGEMSFHACDLK
jgi:hypothetical protein